MLGFPLICCNREEKEFIKPQPIALEATHVGSSGFVASWMPILGASDYIMEVATDELFEESMVNGFPKVVADTTFRVSNLEAGYTYYYRVKASRNGSPTEYSNTIKTQTHELLIPTALDAAEVTPTSFVAQWRSVIEAESYLLFIATDVNFSNLLEGYNGLEVSDTTYAVKEMVINQKYFYKVKAKRGKSTSDYSLIIFASTSDLATPVVGEATEINFTTFTIHWQEVTGATSYLIYVSTDPLVTNPLPDHGPKEVSASSLNIVGLNANTPYFYRVQAKNEFTISGKSEIAYTQTPALDIPVANRVNNIQINSFDANWSAVEQATSYLLDVAYDADFTSFLTGYKEKEVADTSFVVGNLQKSTKYYYRVKAKGLGSVSAHSGVIEVTTNSFASPIALNAVEVKTTSFKAIWQSVLGADGYLLDVATDANFKDILADYNSLTVNDTINLISGLILNKGYYYRVRAIKGGVTSGYSNIVNQSTTDLSKPVLLAPSGITLTSFMANWQTISGASSYLFDLANDPLFTEILPGYNAKSTVSTFVEVFGLDADKTYYYRVRTTNGVAISENSDVGTVKTLAIEPPGVVGATSVQIESFQANWTSVSNADSYLLDVAVDENFKSMVPGFNGRELTGTSEAVTGLEPSTMYYYRVRAKGLNSTSSYSAVISVITAQLPAPVILDATNIKVFEFTANWEESTGASSYLLYVATDASFTQMVYGYNGKEIIGSSSIVTNLNPHVTYYYKLKSKSLSKTSDFSNILTVNARIEANCRIRKREYTGQYREVYSYDSDNHMNKIELFDISVSSDLIREISISNTSGYIDTVYIRKKNGGVMELTEKWVYQFSNNKVSSITKYNPTDNSVIEHLKFIYNNGNLLEIDFYSDEAELVLIDKEVYDFNTYGQIISAKDKDGVEIKRFIYTSEFNGEFLLNLDLQLIYFDPTQSTNQGFASWNDFSYYQYLDKNSGEWKSASLVYEYNSKGVPVKLLGSGSISDLIYEYENCTF